MMKRVFTWALCVMMLVAFGTQCLFVSAANDVTFSLAANDAKAGETVTVELSISADSYFTNASLFLHYDTDVVEYIADSAVVGEVSPSGAMVAANNFADEAYVMCAYATVDGITAEGVLLTFDFTAKSDAPAEFSLTFDECVGIDADDNEFDVVYTVFSCTINNNGEPLSTTTTVAVDDVTTTTMSEDATTTTVTTTTGAGQSDEKVPDTGDSSVVLMAVIAMTAALVAVGVTALMGKTSRN